MKTRWNSFENWPVFAQLAIILTPTMLILWLVKIRVDGGSASVTWVIAMVWGMLLGLPCIITYHLRPAFVRRSWYYDFTYFIGLLSLAWFIGNPILIYLGTIVAIFFVEVVKRIFLR